MVVYAVHMAVLCVWSMLQARGRSRLRDRSNDRGALTTEQAIITAALITLAGVLVAAITAAVQNKLPLIQ